MVFKQTFFFGHRVLFLINKPGQTARSPNVLANLVMDVHTGEHFFRPSGAGFLVTPCTHGLRRGLHSFAASRLRSRPMEG
jgi:hypothetical protein